jgi:response regulator of citrate/malate metabolism
LIDDEAETAGWHWILNEILNRRFGLGVISVTDPEAGLKLLETCNDIDIVLLDVYFDGKSLGIQTLGRIRKRKSNCQY